FGQQLFLACGPCRNAARASSLAVAALARSDELTLQNVPCAVARGTCASSASGQRRPVKPAQGIGPAVVVQAQLGLVEQFGRLGAGKGHLLYPFGDGCMGITEWI